MKTHSNLRLGLFAIGLLAAFGAQASWGWMPQGPQTGYAPVYGPSYFGPNNRSGGPWWPGQAAYPQGAVAPARWPAPIASAPPPAQPAAPYGYRWRPAVSSLPAPGAPWAYRPMPRPMPAWMAQPVAPRHVAQAPTVTGMHPPVYPPQGYQAPGYQGWGSRAPHRSAAWPMVPPYPQVIPGAMAGTPTKPMGAPTAMRPAPQSAWAEGYRFRPAQYPAAGYQAAWRQSSTPGVAPAMPQWGATPAWGAPPAAPSQAYRFRPDDRFHGMQPMSPYGTQGQAAGHSGTGQLTKVAAQTGPTGWVGRDPGVGRMWR